MDHIHLLRKYFIESLYEVLDDVISPTPFLQIKDGNLTEISFLEGKGKLPTENSFEINILDIDIASLFFDNFHILYEGITGIGKTYTSTLLFQTIFGDDGFFTIRLSSGLLGTSVLEPFTKTSLENGVPRLEIDLEACRRYGGIIIDEINRGNDPNEVFQIADRAIHLNGKVGYLEIPALEYKQGKGIAIIAAMNPSDNDHLSAVDLDIAVENRFIKLTYPNAVEEAVSSQLRRLDTRNLHNRFWRTFAEKSQVLGSWRDIYPIITHSTHLALELNDEAQEFLDIAVGYISNNPIEIFQRNTEIMEEIGFTIDFSMREDNELEKVLEAQNNLKHSLVRRDLTKIEDLSRLFCFIRGIKEGNYKPEVTISDVVVGLANLLEGRLIPDSPSNSYMTLLNDIKRAYVKTKEKLRIASPYGIRQSIWQAALYSGNAKGFVAYLKTIEKNISTLNTSVSGVALQTVHCRILTDLNILVFFSQYYQKEVTNTLEREHDTIMDVFHYTYKEKKKHRSLFDHRLSFILGTKELTPRNYIRHLEWLPKLEQAPSTPSAQSTPIREHKASESGLLYNDLQQRGIIHRENTLIGALEKAKEYIATGGYLASLPETIDALMQVDSKHYLYSVPYYQTSTEESVGVDRVGIFGKPGARLTLFIHGGGLAFYSKELEKQTKKSLPGKVFFRHSDADFQMLLKGNLPNEKKIKIFHVEELPSDRSSLPHAYGVAIETAIFQKVVGGNNYFSRKDFVDNPIIQIITSPQLEGFLERAGASKNIFNPFAFSPINERDQQTRILSLHKHQNKVLRYSAFQLPSNFIAVRKKNITVKTPVL